MATRKTMVELRNVLDDGCVNTVFPGGAVAVCTASGSEWACEGHLTYESNVSQVSSNTLYDLASITKSIPTATLALQLVAEGSIYLEDPVIKYLPRLRGKGIEKVQVQQLLRFSVEFGISLSALKNKSAKEIREAVETAEVVSIDQKVVFQNCTSILLGWVIEAVEQEKLERCAYNRIFLPLGLTMTSFSPAPSLVECAPSEIDEWRRGVVQGEVHDESAWKLHQEGEGSVGSAGLFSSISELSVIAEHILRGELPFDARNQTESLSFPSVLGWELNSEWMGSPGLWLVGKSGFTGCCIVFEPKRAEALIFLCNATYPHRPQDRTSINQIRQRLITAWLS